MLNLLWYIIYIVHGHLWKLRRLLACQSVGSSSTFYTHMDEIFATARSKFLFARSK